ncbi:MAG TPA: hypothetical protein VLM40_12580, partial [Gemmata sp.]|nr:hypothetical protein [Gemmata sp.]
MSRRVRFLVVSSVLLGLTAGCRSTCGEPRSWFASNSRCEAPCRLAGNSQMMDGCYDAITGQPVPCSPPGTLVPGGVAPGGAIPRPDELPFPGAGDMIPA